MHGRHDIWELAFKDKSVLELRCLGVTCLSAVVFSGCSMGVAVRKSLNIRESLCIGSAVHGSRNLWESQCLKVTVFGSGNLWELQ